MILPELESLAVDHRNPRLGAFISPTKSEQDQHEEEDRYVWPNFDKERVSNDAMKTVADHAQSDSRAERQQSNG